ncbi:hypothetical protein [Mesorhizobium sp. INR15]|uniref:hypothetical protein n=1 Tax=Mesorhizobium sp. INR15 TaxID=2654248 RepID=UPI00189668BE|nr:hypothetical protein [Mesorhizobium sp. INR15]
MRLLTGFPQEHRTHAPRRIVPSALFCVASHGAPDGRSVGHSWHVRGVPSSLSAAPAGSFSVTVRRVSKTAILRRLLDYVRARHPVTNVAAQIQRSCGVPKAAYRGKKRGYQGVGLSDFFACDLAGIRSTAKTTAGFSVAIGRLAKAPMGGKQ